jgi:hypothetical protein
MSEDGKITEWQQQVLDLKAVEQAARETDEAIGRFLNSFKPLGTEDHVAFPVFVMMFGKDFKKMLDILLPKLRLCKLSSKAILDNVDAIKDMTSQERGLFFMRQAASTYEEGEQ